jgi:hypothetical protein
VAWAPFSIVVTVNSLEYLRAKVISVGDKGCHSKRPIVYTRCLNTLQIFIAVLCSSQVVKAMMFPPHFAYPSKARRLDVKRRLLWCFWVLPPYAGQALFAADRLYTAASMIGHLQHMPSHTYLNVSFIYFTQLVPMRTCRACICLSTSMNPARICLSTSVYPANICLSTNPNPKPKP